MSGPLAGFTDHRVAGIGPGPFGGMMHGPGRRRRSASIGPSPCGVPHRRAVRSLARGRRSVGIDLKHPDGVATVLDLVEQADVLIEGFRPGVTERLGIGPDECLARNPKLVYGRMTGWGQDGPVRALAAGHDINYIAWRVGSATSAGGEAPVPPLNLVGDFGGGGCSWPSAWCAPSRGPAQRPGPGHGRGDGRRRRDADVDVPGDVAGRILGASSAGNEPARHGRPLLRRLQVRRRHLHLARLDRAAGLRRAAALDRAVRTTPSSPSRWTSRSGQP